MRNRTSKKLGPCELCDTKVSARGFEDAHIYAAGVRGKGKNTGGGCDCDCNKVRICRNDHDIMHDIGWTALVKKRWELANRFGNLHLMGIVGLFQLKLVKAKDHYWARGRGETECSAKLKRTWLVKNRRTV